MPEGKWKETLETNIGIVGTEAKINQEDLVKSRRKIWSLPLVLVTALLLVGLLGAAVLAQSNDAPKVTKELEDVITATTLELGGGGVDTTNDIPESATADLSEVFTDTMPNPVADQVATTQGCLTRWLSR